MIELADDLDEIPEGATKSVELPDDEGITPAQKLKSLGEPRTVRLSPAHGILEGALTIGFFEGVELEV